MNISYLVGLEPSILKGQATSDLGTALLYSRVEIAQVQRSYLTSPNVMNRVCFFQINKSKNGSRWVLSGHPSLQGVDERSDIIV